MEEWASGCDSPSAAANGGDPLRPGGRGIPASTIIVRELCERGAGAEKAAWKPQLKTSHKFTIDKALWEKAQSDEENKQEGRRKGQHEE